MEKGEYFMSSFSLRSNLTLMKSSSLSYGFSFYFFGYGQPVVRE